MPSPQKHAQRSMVEADSTTFDTWTIVLGFFALSNLFNGLWMLGDPVHWYNTLPAGVPDFGPLNEHFVRDIGCTYVLMGTALTLGALIPRWRIAACVVATMFYVLHAVVHVIDTTRGLVGPEHWLIDLPGIYIPAVILIGVTVLVARHKSVNGYR